MNNMKQTNEIILMDGSMGRYLCDIGLPQDDLFRKCWSARALVDENYHDHVIAAHKEYMSAGAQILITNSYGVQPTYYRRTFEETKINPITKECLWKEKMLEHGQLSAQFAVQARTEFFNETCVNTKSSSPNRMENENPLNQVDHMLNTSTVNNNHKMDRVQIYGCLPPLVESFRPDLFMEFLEKEGENFIIDMYEQLAISLLSGGVDGLILENLVCFEELRLAIEAIKRLNNFTTIPLIIVMEGSFRNLNLGVETWKSVEFVNLILNYKKNLNLNVNAIGFGCAEPENIIDCLKNIQNDPNELNLKLNTFNIKLCGYSNVTECRERHANGFSTENAQHEHIVGREDLMHENYLGYAKFVEQFVQHGATMVGGCCGCGPEGIETIGSHLHIGMKYGVMNNNLKH